MSKIRLTAIALFAIALLPSGVLAQERGTITGVVVDQSSQRPIVGATVTIRGTTLGTLTNQQGRYLIPGVPTGPQEVVASQLGYAQNSQRVTVGAGETVTANFTLEASALELGAVIVTATGREQRQRELGNAVSQIRVAEVELAPVTNFSQLVQGRAAGVTVLQSSGVTGAGSRIRIRGSNSISLNNSPLIIVDGVRIYDNPDPTGLFTGGQRPSPLNDINPEDIENIEILKGPAASALYGTAAANGVIQVTTKRGRAGAPQFRAWAEAGRLDEEPILDRIPANVVGIDFVTTATGAVRQRVCDIFAQAEGTCMIDTLFTANPLRDPAVTPFRTGDRQVVGASVSGGGESSTYYVSAEYEDEAGIQLNNDLERIHIRANLTGQFRENLDLGVNVGFIDSDGQLPQADNSALGPFLNALRGDPRTAGVEPFLGFRLPPSVGTAWQQFEESTRFLVTGRANWNPFPWLTVNGSGGLDNLNRFANSFAPPGPLALFGPPFSIGLRETWRFNTRNWNFSGSASAVGNLRENLISTTAVGVNYVLEDEHRVFASGAGLSPGTRSLAGATTQFEASETNIENATFGAFLQQQLSWNDRVFLTGAVRGDKNSAFGLDFDWVWYPSLSASWVVSDESFFPRSEWLNLLRLRAAYGQSGLRPSFRDAKVFFVGRTAADESDEVPAFTFGGGVAGIGVGNPDLRPEVATEIELGFESGFIDNRVGLEFTYFNRTSEDALIRRPLAPSLGVTRFRFENLGEVKNEGVELMLRLEAVRTRTINSNLTITGSLTDNKLLELGVDPLTGRIVEPIITGFGDTQRFIEGFPLGAFFDRPIVSFEDLNDNNVIDLNEVTVGDTAVFLGQPFPDQELSFSADLTLWNWVKIAGLLDFKGGHSLFNRTQSSRCTGFGATNPCLERFDPNTPLETQAAIQAFRKVGTQAGFIEEADFWRLREVSVSFYVPNAWLNRWGPKGASITLAGRNLKTWTDFSGFDPEVNFAGQHNFTTADYFTIPAPRVFTARVDLNF